MIQITLAMYQSRYTIGLKLKWVTEIVEKTYTYYIYRINLDLI